MQKLLTLGATLGLLFLLGGCSSKPTLGERMLSVSAEADGLARQWTDSQALLDEGAGLVEDGRRMIEKGKDRIVDGERRRQRGADLVARGEGGRSEAERHYAERFPELYRQLTQGK